MTTGNETDPRDDALAKTWRAQSQEMPPPALDATILAAAHRAVGSGPRDARKQAAEATRPQRWWMPLAAAATIGVVAIGILQIAPQAPVDIVVGERAEVASRVEQAKVVAPTTTAPSTAVPAPVAREKSAAPEAAPAPPPSAAAAALADARKQVAAAPAMPAPEPFPADKLAGKVDAPSAARQNERKDVAEVQSAPTHFPAPMTAPAPTAAPAPTSAPTPAPMLAQPAAPPVARAPATAMLAPAPLKKESAAGAAGSLAAADSAAKPASAARERDAARDDASARNVPAAASAEQPRGVASPAELQARARDPDAWITRIRKLRDDGRVADAMAELRDFWRYVPDADARLPADLRQLLPRP
jgi:Meckel syndrome type 1 protein